MSCFCCKYPVPEWGEPKEIEVMTTFLVRTEYRNGGNWKYYTEPVLVKKIVQTRTCMKCNRVESRDVY